MEKKLSILMLGGAKRVSMARELIRAGEELGVKVLIYSHELSACEPISSVGTVIVGGKYSSPTISAELDAIIAKNNIDILLPFIDPAISVAKGCAMRISGLFVPVSDAQMIDTLFDKVLSAECFASAGLSIPKTYSVTRCEFPAILKPRKGSASKGIIVVNNSDELAAIAEIENYLIQEYIANNREYTIDCYITQKGVINAAVPRIRIATAGGEVMRSETVRNPLLIEQAMRVINALGLRGAVTLQFIENLVDGTFKLMEINPRLGGGVICSIAAGADIAKMIIQECIGAEINNDNETWRDKTLMTRYFQEVIFHNDNN
ncbi:MAG: ATP-grasp domain-containing protein [Bacteroidales bacterium]